MQRAVDAHGLNWDGGPDLSAGPLTRAWPELGGTPTLVQPLMCGA